MVATSLLGPTGNVAEVCVADGAHPEPKPSSSDSSHRNVADVNASQTADGVVALARGDYQRAVEILKPIVETWRREDIAAEFFMAGLYDAGRGVPQDSLRACALYQRAADDHDEPFGRQAEPLFSAFLSRGLEFFDECQFLAGIGWDHGFEPATFTLGPGHFVDWTVSTATVTNGERRKRTAIDFEPTVGMQFLPLRHTELATGPSRSLTRHFIQAFVWEWSPRSASWTLRWYLFEIVGTEVIVRPRARVGQRLCRDACLRKSHAGI